MNQALHHVPSQLNPIYILTLYFFNIHFINNNNNNRLHYSPDGHKPPLIRFHSLI
jgi:hypothetical protein